MKKDHGVVEITDKMVGVELRFVDREHLEEFIEAGSVRIRTKVETKTKAVDPMMHEIRGENRDILMMYTAHGYKIIDISILKKIGGFTVVDGDFHDNNG